VRLFGFASMMINDFALARADEVIE